MPTVHIAGRVQYMPGPWGLDRPAAGAQVEIIDLDANGDDRIWSGTTDTQGRFGGTSSNWQDTIEVPVFNPLRGTWDRKQLPDPGDVLLLRARVRLQGREHVVMPFANGTPVPIVLPWGPVLAREQRALVVVNNTVAGGRQDLRALYAFIEAAGDAVARGLCGPVYGQIRSLNGADASLPALLDTLRALAGRAELCAIDLVLNMHGSPDTMYFHGAAGGVAASAVGRQMAALPGLRDKLRLLYNTSCYGSTHSAAMLQAGFDTAIGGRKVVANSATEYPAFLAAWAGGMPVGLAIEAANAAPLREPMDRYAEQQLHFQDVDSRKLLSGDAGLTIATVPR